MKLHFYNTISHKKEIFKPLKKGVVGLYTCGPTVYHYQHIGNYRTYIFEDILRRMLVENGFRVKHIMNITDVGHLTSDEDSGEDKIERAAKKEGKTAWDIARFYENIFWEDLKVLHVLLPHKAVRATEHIDLQINLIKKLEKKGYTYKTSDGIYFDTSKLKEYGKLAKKNTAGIKAGARIEMGEKRLATDFALWKFSSPTETRQMEWNSPWGRGFPGWHIECSAMSMKYLGETFDIHTGGVDHIQVHHQNEIAQSEAATGKPLARFWLHGEHLHLDNEKMSKSTGNIVTPEIIRQKGFDPLDFRYLMFTAHYRSKMNFTWESLQSVANARRELEEFVRELLAEKKKSKSYIRLPYVSVEKKFFAMIADDLNTPKAIGILWNFIRSYRKARTKNPTAAYALLLSFDHILGLGIKHIKQTTIPSSIQQLVEKREVARQKKHWLEADSIREELQKKGWEVKDTSGEPVVIKK